MITSETWDGRVRVLRMDRVAKKNALTVAMYAQLIAGLRAACDDAAVRVIVIQGAPGIFTAGNDLNDFMQSPPTDTSSPVLQFLHTLVDCTKPLVAVVDGAAVGIGTTMLLHCDLVIASTRASFVLPFVKLGLVPEGGSSLLLPQVIGLQRARAWLIQGSAMAADEAHQAGLVAHLVAPEALANEVIKRTNALAALSPAALHSSRELMRAAQRPQVHAVIDAEAHEFGRRLQSEETQAALAGFFAKR